jgi:hypothetical protein
MKIGNEMAPPPPVLLQLQEYQNKGLINWAVRKCMETKKVKEG